MHYINLHFTYLLTYYGLRSVTCYMGSQCYQPPDTSEHTPTLTPARQAGTRFTYPGGMEG